MIHAELIIVSFAILSFCSATATNLQLPTNDINADPDQRVSSTFNDRSPPQVLPAEKSDDGGTAHHALQTRQVQTNTTSWRVAQDCFPPNRSSPQECIDFGNLAGLLPLLTLGNEFPRCSSLSLLITSNLFNGADIEALVRDTLQNNEEFVRSVCGCFADITPTHWDSFFTPARNSVADGCTLFGLIPGEFIETCVRLGIREIIDANSCNRSCIWTAVWPSSPSPYPVSYGVQSDCCTCTSSTISSIEYDCPANTASGRRSHYCPADSLGYYDNNILLGVIGQGLVLAPYTADKATDGILSNLYHAVGRSPQRLTLSIDPPVVIGSIRIWNRADGGGYHEYINGVTLQVRTLNGSWYQCGDALSTNGNGEAIERFCLYENVTTAVRAERDHATTGTENALHFAEIEAFARYPMQSYVTTHSSIDSSSTIPSTSPVMLPSSSQRSTSHPSTFNSFSSTASSFPTSSAYPTSPGSSTLMSQSSTVSSSVSFAVSPVSTTLAGTYTLSSIDSTAVSTNVRASSSHRSTSHPSIVDSFSSIASSFPTSSVYPTSPGSSTLISQSSTVSSTVSPAFSTVASTYTLSSTNSTPASTIVPASVATTTFSSLLSSLHVTSAQSSTQNSSPPSNTQDVTLGETVTSTSSTLNFNAENSTINVSQGHASMSTQSTPTVGLTDDAASSPFATITLTSRMSRMSTDLTMTSTRTIALDKQLVSDSSPDGINNFGWIVISTIAVCVLILALVVFALKRSKRSQDSQPRNLQSASVEMSNPSFTLEHMESNV